MVFTSVGRRLALVWGANTGVGKTLVSVGLLHRSGGAAHYIKPLQAGLPSDASAIASSGCRGGVTTDTLVQLQHGVSPDLAAQRRPSDYVNDHQLLTMLRGALDVSSEKDTTLVETAGGVLSPAPSGTAQAELYRPLRIPSLLVGDTRLGGISCTCAALESLLLRGYDVPLIVMPALPGTEDEEVRNNIAAVQRAVRGYGLEKDIRVLPVLKTPPRDPSLPIDANWLSETSAEFDAILGAWTRWLDRRRSDLEWSVTSARDTFWWPFTQHKTTPIGDVTVIDSAHRDYLTVYSDGQLSETFDGCGSWWTNAGVRGTGRAALAAGRALGRYGHVLFPEVSHSPALQLAEKLLRGPGRGWAERVFYSDNGSTGIEVALKMAFRLAQRSSGGRRRAQQDPVSVVALDGGYHGDTLAAMDCCPRSTFNEGQTPWYKPRGLYVDPPRLRMRGGEWEVVGTVANAAFGAGTSLQALLDVEGRRASDPLWGVYRAGIDEQLDRGEVEQGHVYGALLMEPVMQASAGMRLIDPLFQRALVEACRARGIPVIYDEVFTGFWRLGSLTGGGIIGAEPDIAVYAKLMTGATVPLAATVASREVFDAFQGSSKAEALLHGHSYTGHPVGCALALETLRAFEEAGVETVGRHRWDDDTAGRISTAEGVAGAASIGTVLAVELEGSGGYEGTGSVDLARALRRHGVFTRALGDVLYVTVSPLTSRGDCRDLGDMVERAVLRKLRGTEGKGGKSRGGEPRRAVN